VHIYPNRVALLTERNPPWVASVLGQCVGLLWSRSRQENYGNPGRRPFVLVVGVINRLQFCCAAYVASWRKPEARERECRGGNVGRSGIDRTIRSRRRLTLSGPRSRSDDTCKNQADRVKTAAD